MFRSTNCSAVSISAVVDALSSFSSLDEMSVIVFDTGLLLQGCSRSPISHAQRGHQHVVEERLVEALAQEHFEYIAGEDILDASSRKIRTKKLKAVRSAAAKITRNQRMQMLAIWSTVAAGFFGSMAILWLSSELKKMLVEILKDMLLEDEGKEPSPGHVAVTAPVASSSSSSSSK